MPRPAKEADRHIDDAVGRRIHMRRRILGLSQESVGAELGISFQQLQKYENGSNRVTASRLYRFSKLLNVPTDFFFEELEQAPTTEAVAQDIETTREANEALSRLGVKVARAFARIPNGKIRKRIADLIGELAAAHDSEEG